MTDNDLKNLLESIVAISRRASLVNVNHQAILILMKDSKGTAELARAVACPYAPHMRQSLDLLERAVERGKHLSASLIDATHTAQQYAGFIEQGEK